MYTEPTIKLLDCIIAVSDALDLASSELSRHQMRTAYISWKIAEKLDIKGKPLEDLFFAALIHDIGALSPEDKIDLHEAHFANIHAHCISGAYVLGKVKEFKDMAEIIRYHHTMVRDWIGPIAGTNFELSQILHLADYIERAIDRKTFILHQNQSLLKEAKNLTGSYFDTVYIEALEALASREDFWLDLVSPKLHSFLIEEAPTSGTRIKQSKFHELSELFRDIIDFRSPFTATHACGVSTAAVLIAKEMRFSDHETAMIRLAGNLHDLGKMAVPNKILNKKGRLTERERAVMRQHTYYTYHILKQAGFSDSVVEWAAFHHEKINGTGYPFHINGPHLDIGARIITVADIATALAEERPYRQPLSRSESGRIMARMSVNREIDRDILDVFTDQYEKITENVLTAQSRAKEAYDQFVNLWK